MDYKEIAIYLLGLLQILIVYVYRNQALITKENFDKIELKTKENFDKIELKIEKIENGDFMKNNVENVMYLPKSREYFKSIFTEVLNHQQNNDKSVNLSMLNLLEKIDSKLSNLKND